MTGHGWGPERETVRSKLAIVGPHRKAGMKNRRPHITTPAPMYRAMPVSLQKRTKTACLYSPELLWRLAEHHRVVALVPGLCLLIKPMTGTVNIYRRRDPAIRFRSSMTFPPHLGSATQPPKLSQEAISGEMLGAPLGWVAERRHEKRRNRWS